MERIAVTADCISDIPATLAKRKGIEFIYYDIVTDKGVFQDTTEITGANILEYMYQGEKKANSREPSAEDYRAFFEKKLKEAEEVIHVCLGSEMGVAVEHARAGRELMGADKERIYIIDSHLLSSGLGMAALLTIELKNEGYSASDIVQIMEEEYEHFSVSFITEKMDYLYYNKRISKRSARIGELFSAHPVMAVSDGKLKLKDVYFGNYQKACKRYIKKTFSRKKNINFDLGFITYLGVSSAELDAVEKEVKKYVPFDYLCKQEACAAVASNCGPGTIGLIYFRNV